MKYICTVMLLVLSFSALSADSDLKDRKPLLEGPYLGQQPPGMTPEVFAPGYVSSEHRDHNGFFNADTTEFYFTRKDNHTGKWSLHRFRLSDSQWHETIIGPRIGRPILTPDGNTMLLGNRYMERVGKGWSEIKSLGPMFARGDLGIMRLSASANGTYVFDDYKGGDVLRISTLKNGKRQKPTELAPHINSGRWTAHPFIAPDESYLIWDTEKEDGYGDKDLYISFRQHDGSWGKALNLGAAINTRGNEQGGYVSPDGKYFFFNRKPYQSEENVGPESDIYWVDARVLYDLREN